MVLLQTFLLTSTCENTPFLRKSNGSCLQNWCKLHYGACAGLHSLRSCNVVTLYREPYLSLYLPHLCCVGRWLRLGHSCQDHYILFDKVVIYFCIDRCVWCMKMYAYLCIFILLIMMVMLKMNETFFFCVTLDNG